MSRVTGREIGYNPVSVKKFGEIYAEEGDGQELASMYAVPWVICRGKALLLNSSLVMSRKAWRVFEKELL